MSQAYETARKRHGASRRDAKVAQVSKRIQIIHAMMMREALSKYGHDNLGFFWIVGEPLAFTVGIIILWSSAHMSHGEGVDVVGFALTGYTYITMWRHIYGRSLGMMKKNKHLSYHRSVRKTDSFIAMATLELIACFASFCVAYVSLWLFHAVPTINDPLPLLTGYGLGALFALGFGLFLAGLSSLSEAVHHIIGPAMYITLPLTGTFSMQAWLPPSSRDILAWSPLVNGIEMFRSGFFPPDIETRFSSSYLVCTSVGMLLIGLWTFTFGVRHGDQE